jgi:hypothetical protein
MYGMASLLFYFLARFIFEKKVPALCHSFLKLSRIDISENLKVFPLTELVGRVGPEEEKQQD